MSKTILFFLILVEKVRKITSSKYSVFLYFLSLTLIGAVVLSVPIGDGGMVTIGFVLLGAGLIGIFFALWYFIYEEAEKNEKLKKMLED